ncbi:MAG TPA: hypothetical protein VGN51_20750 [Acidimicrobiia bacterium]
MNGVEEGTHTYSLFGRRCTSAVSLPELDPLASTERPAFSVSLGPVSIPEHRGAVAAVEGDDVTMAVLTVGDTTWLRFARAAVFRADEDSGAIAITVDPGVDTEHHTIRHLLLDDVIPFLIAKTGTIVLHCASVLVGDRALLILGESGMGKSTLSAWCSLAGMPLLSDDCTVVDATPSGMVAQPSYPSVRLWDATAIALLGSTGDGLPFSEFSKKRRYRRDFTFGVKGAVVSHIVQIAWPRPEAPDSIEIEELSGHESFAVAHAGQYLPEGATRAQAVAGLLELSGQAQVGRLRVPTALDRLSELRDALVSWMGPGS